MPRETPERESGVVTQSRPKPKTKPPPLYKVLFHNDDYTTMEFVVWVLQAVFHHDETTATAIMLHVHRRGTGVAEVLSACGVDVPRLEREMAAYLDQQVEQLPPGLDQPPQQTLGFQRILQRAAAHVQSSGKDEVDGRNVLVAIFREPDSHAAHVLADRGVTRLDVITYLSHGIAKVPDAPAPGSGDEDEGDEDDEGGG